MIADIVRLALKEHDHAGAIQRAGAGVLSFIRRETKIAIALHRMYGPKKCFGPGPRPNRPRPTGRQGSRPNKRPNKADRD